MGAEPKLGIPLSQHEIQAFEEGEKTQIRLIAVRHPGYGNGNVRECADGSLQVEQVAGGCGAGWYNVVSPVNVGDVVFVREPWSALFASYDGVVQVAYPRAPRGGALWKQRSAKVTPEKEWQAFLKKYDVDHNGQRIRPNTQMKAWASRVLLTIQTKRAERLQAISLNDTMNEGYEHRGDPKDAENCIKGTFYHNWFTQYPAAKYGENPWVWVFNVKAEIRPCTPRL